MKKYLVIRSRERFDPEKEGPIGWIIADFDDFESAQIKAARMAGISNEHVLVAQILGQERPIYDPEIGWEPYG